MKVTMYPAMSLDGFIADLSGDSDSWSDPNVETEFERAVQRAGCAIVGGNTYKQYEEDFSSQTSNLTFVCTREKEYKDTEHIKFIRGTADEMYKIIEDYGFSEIILSGGGEINGLFAQAGLVDEIIANIFPLTLGEGIHLFGPYRPKLKLELLSSVTNDAGVTKNRYKVLR